MADIASKLADHDQSQLLTPAPPAEKQEGFYAKLKELDFPKLKSTFETSLSQSSESRNLSPFKDVTEISSLSAETAASYRADGLTNAALGASPFTSRTRSRAGQEDHTGESRRSRR